MADLTSPDAIAFANTEVRPACDNLSRALSRIDDILIALTPQAKNMQAAFAADPTGAVVDGSPADGRTHLACSDALMFFGLCAFLKNVADTTLKDSSGNDTGVTPRQLISKIAVNG